MDSLVYGLAVDIMYMTTSLQANAGSVSGSLVQSPSEIAYGSTFKPQFNIFDSYLLLDSRVRPNIYSDFRDKVMIIQQRRFTCVGV